GWSAEMPGGGWIGFAYEMVGRGRNARPTDNIFLVEKQGGGCLGTCPWKHVETLDTTGKNSHQVLDDYYSGRYSHPVAAPPAADPPAADLKYGADFLSSNRPYIDNTSGIWGPGPNDDGNNNGEDNGGFKPEDVKAIDERREARDTGKVSAIDLTGKTTYNLPGDNYTTLSLMPHNPASEYVTGNVVPQLGRPPGGGKSKRKRRRNKKTRRNSKRKTKRRR
ncbi:hypothetical protein EB093_09470, partial [bacterium]|nr:hypothetical protein [bacterium]